MDSKIIQKLFEGLDKNILTDETKDQVSSMIEELVNTRVAAKTTEFEEKLKAFESREKLLVAKEKILAEEAENFAKKIAKDFRDREQIMFEELDNYKALAEQIVLESCDEYRKAIEEIVIEEAENSRKHMESILVSEAGEFKKQQDTALAEEVNRFKDDLVEKISEFMESELTKAIPEDIMEAAAENAALKPLVEGMINTFGKNYIQLDSTSMDVIKEAKAEINKLNEAYNVKAKETVRLSAKVRELEKTLKLESLTKGMTASQKEKTFKLLEGYNVDEVENKFNQIKDIIITESVRQPQRVSKTELNEGSKPQLKTVNSESVRKQIDRIQNPKTILESTNPEMAAWKETLSRQLKQG